MNTLFRSALVIVAILASTSATIARPSHVENGSVAEDANSSQSVRAYWDEVQRNGN